MDCRIFSVFVVLLSMVLPARSILAKEPPLMAGEPHPTAYGRQYVHGHRPVRNPVRAKSARAKAAPIVISALPIDILSPGTYVLDSNLTISGGEYAIWIKSSDVTLDCQNNSISTASTVMAIGGNEGTGNGYSDVTVQNCVLSGFAYGITTGNSGVRHRVLNNAVLGSRYRAITVWGDDMLVKDNRIWGMRGVAGTNMAGIQVGPGYFGNTHTAQVIGNTVADLLGSGSANTYGIRVVANDDVTISGNAIMDFRSSGSISFGIGPDDIYGYEIDMVVENNVLMDRIDDLQAFEPRPFGSLPFEPAASLCAHNVFIGFPWAEMSMCAEQVGGSVIP